MQDRIRTFTAQTEAARVQRNVIRQVITLSALLVVVAVFWWLKLTGITIAGEAFCGMAEHSHGHSCLANCPLIAHVHDKTCYSDIRVDAETPEIWEKTLTDVRFSGSAAEDLVAVAESQMGYQESSRNFQVDAQGIRHGITRYGQWYGNPYGDWSAMFAGFCLRYAGIDNVPVSGAVQTMQLRWQQAGLYRSAQSYTPRRGDLLFLSGSGGHAVAIITGFSDDTITVVEGDRDGRVVENTYHVQDPAVRGYGLVPDRAQPTILAVDSSNVIAETVSYSKELINDQNCFLLYTTRDGVHYAMDGSGQAVPITIHADGDITADVADANALLWTFSGGERECTIQNLSTGRYLYVSTGQNGGVTSASANASTLVPSGTGIRIRSGSRNYATLNEGADSFVVTQDVNGATVYQLGITQRYTVWLDGTAGGQGQLGGSVDRGYTAAAGAMFQLPTSWQSPVKYQQKLRGWYDVTNQRYYAPGDQVQVTDNMVFYADWIAASYDFGQFNNRVSNTVSTNSFITTHVFDYNYLFNVLSANASITANAQSHSEIWTMIENGKVAYGNQDSLEFVFVDYDGSSRLPDMANRNDGNRYHGVGIITQGLYNAYLANILFGTDNNVIGKTYLGTGDHLFQFMSDPTDEYYGYFYYDSRLNAASYNQSEGRFYVYDYLAATTDSLNSDTMSDFLPFNSPYANTNGKTVRTYSYAGINGEYVGTTHYYYDSKYSNSNNSTDYMATNYAFGVRMDVNFYLPNRSGEVDEHGKTGNRDVFGNEMHFQFNGDDDVWVLVDGLLVLDIGGIHGVEGGDINFATGVVTVNGEVNEALSAALKTVAAGEHVLTILYLERGSSQSNAAFYFNLAPRYSLTIQKEDVLTQQVLSGAEFSVYTDAACTVPARLYDSEEAYYNGQNARNTFPVTEGVAQMWGLAAGGTYYIKETKGPDVPGYGIPNGMIRVVIDKDGAATYYVEVLPESDGTPVSHGFTVHGVRIGEETQSMYICVTNAPESVTEVATVQVYKQWGDTRDHSGDYITVYLTVTDPDGTIRRIREVVISEENGWMYTWTNLAKYDYESLTEVQYGIEESYESGYYSTVRKVTEINIQTSVWAEALEFVDGQVYLLRTTEGCLSTVGAGSDIGYKWVSEEEAKLSPYALWTAHIVGKEVKLTNEAGQIITFYYGGGSPTDFYASTGGESTNAKQYFRWASAPNGLRLYFDAPNNRDYYLTSGMNNANKFQYSTNANSGLVFTPLTKITTTDIVPATDWAYQITNTPLSRDNETSLTVTKYWDLGLAGKVSDYERAQVTVKLLANGVDTGRSVTLSLKNHWTATFQGLPYRDEEGTIIAYTVMERWETSLWKDSYGPIHVLDGVPPTYTTSVTNTHVSTGGPELPSTGTAARMLYILCGSMILMTTLIYRILIRHKREGRRA